MAEPLAYLLTWTCYGTWLHGDRRGSVHTSIASRGAPLEAPSERRRAVMRNRLDHEPVHLPPDARRVVEAAVADHCAHRSWWLGACNARSNHVHCVVAAPGAPPERVLQQLKMWSTRRLREQTSLDALSRLWTDHRSARYLWDQPSVDRAIEYTLEAQDLRTRFEPLP